jgi:hypothetical protein
VAEYGENDATIQLCANCHELYHLMYNYYINRTGGNLLGQVLYKLGVTNSRTQRIYEIVMHANELERKVVMLACEEAIKQNEVSSL